MRKKSGLKPLSSLETPRTNETSCLERNKLLCERAAVTNSLLQPEDNKAVGYAARQLLGAPFMKSQPTAEIDSKKR